MPGKFQAGYNGRPPKKKNHTPLIMTSLVVLAVVLFIIIRLAESNPTLQNPTNPTDETKKHGWFQQEETEPPTEAPTAPTIVSTATITNTGDVLMHMPLVNSGKTSSGYDFSGMFQYIDSYVEQADYAVANLETTLAGTDNGYSYSGYPCFNCPDAIAQNLKDAGFDLLLTVNNHCYDTRTTGLKRTLEVVSGLGLETLGTQLPDGAKYQVREINGIPVGMLCYSYATKDDYPDRPSMNGILTGTDAAGMINYFDYDNLEAFYTEVEGYLETMEAAGAKATVMYIHWGEEYQLQPNGDQRSIAQRLCDMGIDVIVGGHPHVVQPVSLITSTNERNATVCLYSMGNAVSNQRKGNMNLKTGHTEDGVLFSFTFAEYSDGTVRLDSVDLLPTWVYMGTENNNRIYRILPLDKEISDWGSTFNISQSNVSAAESSWQRTMDLVSEGLAASNEYLTAQRELALTTIP